MYRSAAITIQSHWRMFLAQKKLGLKKVQINAATLIQAAWRGYKERKWFKKLTTGIVIVQARVRGYVAREAFKIMKQKIQKERLRLRSTQSLPTTDRSHHDPYTAEIIKSAFHRPHHSLDSNLEDDSRRASAQKSLPPVHHLIDESVLSSQTSDVLQKAGTQLRNLIISSSSGGANIRQATYGSSIGNENYLRQNSHDGSGKYSHYQNLTDDYNRYSKLYEPVRKYSSDNTDLLKRHEMFKPTVRRTDSGPPMAHDVDYEDIADMSSYRKSDYSTSYTISSRESSKTTDNILSSPPYTSPPPHILSRLSDRERDILLTRTPGDEINANYEKHYENVDPLPMASDLQCYHDSHQKSSYAKQKRTLDEMNALTQAGSSSSTPRGKAATLLGSISEDQCQYTMKGGRYKQTAKGRRVKSNLSDDLNVVSLTPQYRPNNDTSTDSLKRRNSDPTTNKVPLLEVNRGNDMYQWSTQINIAGHRFRSAAGIGKAEKCASCQESDAFVNEGYRCLDCKVLVHTKCIQNGGVKTLQCEAKRSKRLRKNTDKTLTPNSKYSGTREYTDSTDRIISDAKELNLMQDFITQKIYKMESEGEKASDVDRVFKQALRAFKENLVTQYSVAHKQNSDSLNIKYRDLIDNFGQVMETCCGKKDFPLTMGVNAFRGFMNEFMNTRETEKPKVKRKKDKKRKAEEHTNFNGHSFQLTIINIPTVCEICQLFLLWPIERGVVCQNCRLTCHKKCYQKALPCNKISQGPGSSSSNPQSESKLFGVPLVDLCFAEGAKIPVQIEQLITKIEMHGLYSEGIYRKSGVNSKIKELKVKMSEKAENTEIDFESYNVHVLANVLKTFLRDMPEPLLTFDRYDDFLRAADLPDTNVRVQTLLSLIKKLPPTHHSLLERLIFHLALVAQREKHNRMSASSLAIVFAPCVLRTNRMVPAQDSLNDIGRQTKCIETLITQKMLNVKSTLADIDTLDTAAHTATTRLSTLRSSKVFSPEELTPRPNIESETEEMILEGHIQEIRKEKALLTSTLPNLVRATSDDDLLSTDLEGEGGSLDDLSTGRDKDSHSLLECRDFKDSVDSSIGSLSDNLSRKTIDNDPGTPNVYRELNIPDDVNSDIDSLVLRYNVPKQSIDYSPSSRHHHQSLDQPDTPKSSSSISSNFPLKSSSNLLSGSRWTGSQQNLNYSVNSKGSTPTTMGLIKPLAIRSMSGGYEQTIFYSPSQSSVVNMNPEFSNKNSIKDSNKNGNNRGVGAAGKKKPDNIDDEPIMV